jgi:hypothetical protein
VGFRLTRRFFERKEPFGVETVWEAPYGLSGDGVNVFVYDVDVVDSSHPDFGDPSRVVEGEEPGETEFREHPTHVAGTLGGGRRPGAGFQGHGPCGAHFLVDVGLADRRLPVSHQ